MKAIGGYFELELSKNCEYHEKALRLNTGRNALEYILLSNKYCKIYLPYFTCDVLMQPIKKLGIKFEFYSIDKQFEPIFDYKKMKEEECFLYTNYFGLKDSCVSKLSKKCKNLVVDNAQSFYSQPIENIDTFYSPRKFFGIPDGAYLFTNKRIEEKLDQDESYQRFEHLLIRIDKSAEEGYRAFSLNDAKFDNLPILEMSNLTKALLASIDYNSIANKRISNYIYLDEKLKSLNKLKIVFSKNQVPMVYPFWSNSDLKKKLLDHKIYCASYWPNVLEWADPNSLEYQFTQELIHIPIDHRYDEEEMELIVNIILNA